MKEVLKQLRKLPGAAHARSRLEALSFVADGESELLQQLGSIETPRSIRVALKVQRGCQIRERLPASRKRSGSGWQAHEVDTFKAHSSVHCNG